MILVDNYIGAILCCVYCCLCWGSWANTQKMVTSKSWSFELFYWDLTFGLFFTALLGALHWVAWEVKAVLSLGIWQ